MCGESFSYFWLSFTSLRCGVFLRTYLARWLLACGKNYHHSRRLSFVVFLVFKPNLYCFVDRLWPLSLGREGEDYRSYWPWLGSPASRFHHECSLSRLCSALIILVPFVKLEVDKTQGALLQSYSSHFRGDDWWWGLQSGFIFRYCLMRVPFDPCLQYPDALCSIGLLVIQVWFFLLILDRTTANYGCTRLALHQSPLSSKTHPLDCY